MVWRARGDECLLAVMSVDRARVSQRCSEVWAPDPRGGDRRSGAGLFGRGRARVLVWVWVALIWVFGLWGGAGAEKGAEVRLPAGVTYRLEVLEKPRRVRVHELVVELEQGGWELAVAIAPDPDGPGGAEAQLMSPMELAARAGLVVAVNANAFAWLDGASGREAPARWREGMRVDILGWAHDGRREVSRPERRHWSVWQEPAGRVRLGQVDEGRPVRWAASGFGALVMAGQEVPVEGRTRHPRTAVGLDATGRRLWWVVVDGRRPGYSEGMTLRELAGWMRQRGCWEAVNLDGGGSSVLLARGAGGRLEVVNRPSEGSPRPLPVLMGLRVRN